MSTQPANESATQRAMSLRPPVRRPHLVSATEMRLQAEPVVEAAIDVERAPDVPMTGISFPDSTRRLPARAPASISMPAGTAAVAKRILDVIGALVLGVVFAPLIVVIVCLMARRGESVIYRHRRVGRGGQIFFCLKFRTMIPNADQVLDRKSVV